MLKNREDVLGLCIRGTGLLWAACVQMHQVWEAWDEIGLARQILKRSWCSRLEVGIVLFTVKSSLLVRGSKQLSALLSSYVRTVHDELCPLKEPEPDSSHFGHNSSDSLDDGKYGDAKFDDEVGHFVMRDESIPFDFYDSLYSCSAVRLICTLQLKLVLCCVTCWNIDTQLQHHTALICTKGKWIMCVVLLTWCKDLMSSKRKYFTRTKSTFCFTHATYMTTFPR